VWRGPEAVRQDKGSNLAAGVKKVGSRVLERQTEGGRGLMSGFTTISAGVGRRPSEKREKL